MKSLTGNCLVIGQLTWISVSDWLKWFSAISPHDKYKDHQFNSHSLDFNSSLKTVPYPADILPQLPCFWLASISLYTRLIGWKLSQSEFIVTVNYQLHFYTCPFSKMRDSDKEKLSWIRSLVEHIAIFISLWLNGEQIQNKLNPVLLPILLTPFLFTFYLLNDEINNS